ncbi:MAG: hypothetical protein KC800_17635 [Candidatus Eremiobacteraeota bacterium]|nr:hypothetical protein [Candidatus Eremiobacteraeota bacterium]
MNGWLRRNSVNLLRISVSIIFLWFGVLKFLEGVSPVQNLAISTIRSLTFGVFSDSTIIYSLALTEVVVGLSLLFDVYVKQVLYILYFQIVGTFAPFVIYPEVTFTTPPFFLSLEGQYIVKNLVILAAGFVISTHHCGKDQG